MKRDLYFATPYLNAAGSLGLDPARYLRSENHLPLGAFVTNPLSLRSRRPTHHPALVDYPGGFLLHSGLPNPGLDAALKRYARKWRDSPLPVIPHLMADRPEETARMTRQLENIENVWLWNSVSPPAYPMTSCATLLKCLSAKCPSSSTCRTSKF
jgi:dihydroorotate dehydrogenase (NAD+) catalytic subunit